MKSKAKLLLNTTPSVLESNSFGSIPEAVPAMNPASAFFVFGSVTVFLKISAAVFPPSPTPDNIVFNAVSLIAF